MSTEFLLYSLIVILLPGTGVLYTVAVGLNKGFRLSVAAALGCSLGIMPAALASILGLAAIFHTSAIAFQAVKYMGVAYLFYMAWSMFKEHGSFNINQQHIPKSTLITIKDGIVLNILNPKLSFFFLAFLPQFLPDGNGNTTITLIYLAIIFMVMTFVVFILYGTFASLARTYILTRPKVVKGLRYIFAGAFAFLGMRLASS